jgi:hypothetical protein
MNQILHIFYKDARKHWLEILISLALLILYARHESPLWPESPVYGYLRAGSVFLSLVSGLVIPALIFFWGFLILRLVQDETLVGDRQWWVTKPYVWWKLLLAKLLFVAAFISFPLFIVQLYLLRHAGFPAVSNLRGVVRMQFVVPLVIILISLLLACLTRNLGQALLAIGLSLLYIIFAASISSALRPHTLQETSKFWDNVQVFLLIAPVIVVPIWQFARRRTWASRGTLISCVAASTLLSFIPGNSVDRSYPLVKESAAPAHLSISAAPQKKSPAPTSGTTQFILNLPLDLSAMDQNTLVELEGLNVSADSAEDSRWSSGWQAQHSYWWPEIKNQTLSYQLKQQEYEQTKSKPLNLHIQLLLSEYKTVTDHALQVSPATFHDPFLGICRVMPAFTGGLECLRPLRDPSYVARFDEAASSCLSPDDRTQNAPPGWGLAHATSALTESTAPSAALNPVVRYQMYFGFDALRHSADDNLPQKYAFVTLCPGAEIQIMRPKFQRKVRVQLDLPQRRLEEFAEAVPQTSGGTSYDLRSIF